MNSKGSRVFCIALVLLFCVFSSPNYILAHKVFIYAWVENGQVYTESGFSKKSRARHSDITAYDAETGAKLFTGKTNENGECSFPVPKEILSTGHGLRVEVFASDGHRNDWTIPPDELGAVVAGDKEQTPQPEAKQEPKPGAVEPVPVSNGANLEKRLDDISRQLHTINRILADTEGQGPSMVEIFGGIGWIIGLFGVAMFFSSRRK